MLHWSVAEPRVNCFLATPINGEDEVGQTANIVFQIFGMKRPGIEPSLPASVVRAQPTVKLAGG